MTDSLVYNPLHKRMMTKSEDTFLRDCEAKRQAENKARAERTNENAITIVDAEIEGRTVKHILAYHASERDIKESVKRTIELQNGLRDGSAIRKNRIIKSQFVK